MIHFVPSSGGKDSTALLLRLMEISPENIQPVITPTGDELPEMEDHWARLEEMTKPFIRIPCPSLFDLIDLFEALPNWRQRWCTRLIKIVPFEKFIQTQPYCAVSVGLRADETPELRAGMEMKGPEFFHVCQLFPFRQWGWNLYDVMAYLGRRGVKVPKRTDCGCCFFQRLIEWYMLWINHPDRFEMYVQLEQRIGHTFRSPGRDTWPASLNLLRAEFQKGRIPKERKKKEICRVCSL